MLAQKKILLAAIIFSLVFPAAADSSEDMIRLSDRDSNLLLQSFVGKIAEERINRFVLEDSEPEEGAVLVLLEKAVKTNSFNYLITRAPREIIMDIARTAVKVIPAVMDLSFSTLANLGLNEAREYLIDWLVKNELRVSGGNLMLSYTAYTSEPEEAVLPYILTYDPESGNVEIAIYSPEKILPPKSAGSLSGYSIRGGGFWDEEAWIKSGLSSLSLFTVEISGRISPDQYRGYLWERGPDINIFFSDSVPFFDLEEISRINSLNRLLVAARKAFEKLGSGTTALRNLWESVASKATGAINIGGAAISSMFFPSPEKETVVSLEAPKKIEENPSDEEIEDLIKEISRLEEEFSAEAESSPVVEKVNINTASAEDLARIIHIGPSKAGEIIKMRPFYSLDDLLKVSGIGEKILADIKNQGLAYVDEFLKDLAREEKEEKEEDREDEDFCSNGIDVNSASAEELSFLPGIGPVLAQRIIDGRPFYSLDDLLNVAGIGTGILANIKEQGCAYADFPEPSKQKKEDTKEKEEECGPNSIEINTAEKRDLERIVNIGPAYADQIILLRKESPFLSIDDLGRISGITKDGAKLFQIKEQGCAYVDENLLPPDEDPSFPEEIEITGAEAVWHANLPLSDMDNDPVAYDLLEAFASNRETAWQSSLVPPEFQEIDTEDPESEDEDFCSNGIDVNSASAEELSFLPGIGPVLAQRIIDGRPFYSLDDLLNVAGIGTGILANIKEQGCAYADFPDEDPSFPEEIEITGAEAVWHANLPLSDMDNDPVAYDLLEAFASNRETAWQSSLVPPEFQEIGPDNSSP